LLVGVTGAGFAVDVRLVGSSLICGE